MNSQIEQLVELFKAEPGFDRLFQQLYAKYRSYERLEKQVTLLIEEPTPSEKAALGGLLGMDYSKSKRIKISVGRLEKALQKTKYAALLEQYSFVEIVEAYYGQALISKRLETASFLEERTAYFASLMETTTSAYFHDLLRWMEQERKGQHRFYQLYRQDRKLLASVMPILIRACEAFPLEEEVYLPVFAARITSDPHALDADREAGKLFIYMLQILNGLYGAPKSAESRYDSLTIRNELNAEEISELLLNFRILRDDLLNFVTLFHMLGYQEVKESDHYESLLLKGAVADQAAVHLPLREVIKLKSVRAATPENEVYMIENSAVSVHVINKLIQTGQLRSFITGNGRLNRATLRFLDIFVEGGGTIYYAGDFDPEGLGIAQKLLYRYGEQLKLWMCSVDNYRRALSTSTITPERLKQLQSIDHVQLQAVKDEMLLRKRAGYQENIIDEMLADLI